MHKSIGDLGIGTFNNIATVSVCAWGGVCKGVCVCGGVGGGGGGGCKGVCVGNRISSL